MSTAMAKVAMASARARGQVLGIWGGQCHGEGQCFGAMPEPRAMVMARDIGARDRINGAKVRTRAMGPRGFHIKPRPTRTHQDPHRTHYDPPRLQEAEDQRP